MLNSRDPSLHQIAPGMDVCDVSGEKVGTVDRVRDELVEVKSGPFGLGKRLYVPSEAVDDVTEAGVILRHSKQEFHNVGLDARPDQMMDWRTPAEPLVLGRSRSPVRARQSPE